LSDIFIISISPLRGGNEKAQRYGWALVWVQGPALISGLPVFKGLPTVTDGASPHFPEGRIQAVPGFPVATSRISLRIHLH